MVTPVFSARKSPEMLEYLARRRSVPIKDIGGIGPDSAQLAEMLGIAARVPDHGKLAPWYFMTFTGTARGEIGKIIRDVFARKNPDAAPEQLEIEAGRFERAPVVVAVVSRRREGKSPWWEQILSAGVVCYNLCLAAHAMGFAAVWLSEWVAYDPEIAAALGLEPGRDHIAGFIYIGDMKAQPEDRERPALENIVTAWAPGVTPQKGDQYDRAGFGFGPRGFD